VRVFIFLALLMTACKFQPETSLPHTATTVRVVQVSPVPTVQRALQSLAVSETPTPEITETPVPCPQTGGLPTVRHEVDIDLDYTSRNAAVNQTTSYINRTSDPLNQIVFSIEPNRVPQAFMLESVAANGSPVPAFELTGRMLTVELSEALQPGCALSITLAYQLQIPMIGDGINGYQGYFGYSGRQINFGNALPVASPRANGEWVNHPTANVGEQYVAESSDWHVSLSIANAPENLILAAPGRVEEPESNHWDMTLPAARDFTFSLSDAFHVMSQTSANGVVVEMYTFDDAIIQGVNGSINGAAHALEAATRAVEMFSDLYGQYPYERLVIVQGDFPDGMEHSGITFVGGDWFRTYNGTPQSYLFLITIHEVAHQWWYGQVGNDQAYTPYLDEALATYSEMVFLEEFYPELRDWWWAFRVDSFVPSDFTGASVDSTVYVFDTIRAYINAVYLRGAQMLEVLREDLGTDAFFDWLRQYAAVGAGRVMSAESFWSLLTPEQLAQTEATRSQYLSQPNP
jgi:hypothetical protein